MKLIWLDLETTGLNPYEDYVLEIAVFESDFATPFNVRKIYERTFAMNNIVEKTMDPFVVEMHTKSGLLAECKQRWESGEERFEGVSEAEAALLDLIPAAYDDRPVLAGSTIHFDRDFLREWMPRVEGRFHHRHYDVSAIKLFCESMGMPKIPKGEAHRAAADVLESVDHAKKCAAWLAYNSDKAIFVAR